MVNFFGWIDAERQTNVPLYEYKCRKCGKHTDKIEKYTGPFLKKCPACGGSVERVQSAPAIQFKGTGWYVTDYAKSGSKDSKSGSQGDGQGKQDGSGKQEGSATGEKGDSKGDTKGDQKSGAKTDKGESNASSSSKEKKKSAAKER